MNSKGWKLGFFAIAAVVALSACGNDKKKSHGGSPYAGIWIRQDNMREFQTYAGRLGAGDSRGYCERVSANVDRFGNSRSNYQLRALVIQANGEVLNYRPGIPVTHPNYRRANYVGSVGPKGVFTAGYMSTDGRVIPSQTGVGEYGVPVPTTMNVRGDVLMVVTGDLEIIYHRYDQQTALDYGTYTNRCLRSFRQRTVVREQTIRGGGGYVEGQGAPHGSGPIAQGQPHPRYQKDGGPGIDQSQGQGAPVPQGQGEDYDESGLF